MAKRGPAPRGEYAGKSKVLSTRIRPDTRAALELAKKDSGRSLSQEIEYRLRRSFQADDKIEAAFGSRRNYRLMQLISICTQTVFDPDKFNPDADWLDDPASFEIAFRAVVTLLEAVRPPGAIPKSSDFGWLNATQTPAHLLHGVQKADASLPLGVSERRHLANVIKAELGEVVRRPRIINVDADELLAVADAMDRKITKTKRGRKARKK
jgi:hypothetical protein